MTTLIILLSHETTLGYGNTRQLQKLFFRNETILSPGALVSQLIGLNYVVKDKLC